jgi:site-specific recombinase XerD
MRPGSKHRYQRVTLTGKPERADARTARPRAGATRSSGAAARHSSARARPLAEIRRRAAAHALNALAPSTRRGYAIDWRDFESWCRAHRLAALPAAPKTVGLFLTARAAALKLATLKRRLAAIAKRHRLAGADLDLSHPAIRDVLAGIRRWRGSDASPKHALSPSQLRSMLRAASTGVRGRRDRALLLLGYAGALRRSEIVALDCDALQFSTRGVALIIRRSKTDPLGKGAVIGIPSGRNPQTCPVRALKSWLAAAAIEDGAVFRGIDRHGRILGRLSDRGVARIVKRCAAAAGLDAEAVSGHSLRSGFATSAAAAGADLAAIMLQTRHRSASTARRYIQRGGIFRNTAVRALRL